MGKLKCPECGNLVDSSLSECNVCGYQFESVDNEVEKDFKLDKEIVSGEENAIKIVDEGTDNNSDDKKKEKINHKKVLAGVSVAVIVVLFIYAISASTKCNNLEKKYKTVSEQLENKKNQEDIWVSKINELEEENAKLKEENEELLYGASKQLIDVKNAFEKGEWQNTIDLANKLHEEYNGTEEDIQAQEMAKVSQAKLDEAAAAKAAEEAKGYETGITYNQLARTPDDYKGKKVKFYGKVVQVIEDDDAVQIRLAVNGDYDTILFGEYATSTVSSRVLEDDMITIYGTSVGTISYQSTMGGKITIPGVYIEKIDQ